MAYGAIPRTFEETPLWDDLSLEIDTYARDGAAYVVAIDPFARRFETRGTKPERLELDTDAIVDA